MDKSILTFWMAHTNFLPVGPPPVGGRWFFGSGFGFGIRGLSASRKDIYQLIHNLICFHFQKQNQWNLKVNHSKEKKIKDKADSAVKQIRFWLSLSSKQQGAMMCSQRTVICYEFHWTIKKLKGSVKTICCTGIEYTTDIAEVLKFVV